MKTYFVLILLMIATVSFASAIPASVDYNNKIYFVVTSTDPAMDTGNEVCAMIGQTCVGYTEETNAVCKLFHPTAASTSSLSGDKAGVYCNGAPQTGVCAGKTNTCHECPACTNTVTCNTPIGNLYREMFVECKYVDTGKCKLNINSKNTRDFLNEIPSINTQLNNCPLELPTAVSMVLSGSGIIRVDIKLKDNTYSSFYTKKSGKKIEAASNKALGNLNYMISTDEEAVDLMLTATNQFGTFSTLYASKRIVIKGVNLWSKIKLFFLKPVLSIVANNNKIQLMGPGGGGGGAPAGGGAGGGTGGAGGGGAASAPSDCFETAYRAHIGYNENHALWDRYMSETTNVCQSIYGKGMPSPCVYTVQLSRNGQPYYLCWYGKRDVPTPLPADIGRPKNCEDTAYQAHPGYNQNSEMWDRYMADSNGVCQSVHGKPIPSPCKYSVQLSRAGTPYYLCWYD